MALNKTDKYSKIFEEASKKSISKDLSYAINVSSDYSASGTTTALVKPVATDVGGNFPDTLRGQVVYYPQIVAQMGYIAQGEYRGNRLEMINGENRQAYTFTRGDASFMVIPVKGNTNGLDDIIDITGKIYDYCDINGISKDQPIDINFNNFLDSLDYKRDEGGSHDRKVKEKVWNTILNISNTPFNLVGGKNTTAIFRESLIKVTAVYDTKNQLKAVADYERGKPPTKFQIIVLTQLYYQMKGYSDRIKHIPKNVVIKPKIPATKLNKEYQGGVKKCLDTIFYKIHDKPVGIRFIPKAELLVAWGGYQSSPSKRIKKLVDALNLFENDGYLKGWGFAITKNKRLNKAQIRSPLVWIDIEETATFKQMATHKRGSRSEKARENKIRKLEKSVKNINKTIRKNVKGGIIDK